MKTAAQLFIIMLLLFFASCKKDWLDAKPDQSLVVPATIKDFQSLLDNAEVLNLDDPNIGELGSDDYYITDAYFNARSDLQKKQYTWAAGNIFSGIATVLDWTNPYRKVFYSNNVLEGIEKVPVTPDNKTAWRNVKGSAHFFRAYAFYNLSQLFCKTYNTNSADTDLGIILRTSSNINITSHRSTVRETYDQIINDLMIAKDLLPNIPLYKTRPSKPAAFALLARTFLLMGNYDRALLYADSSLQLYASLLDFNPYQSQAAPLPDFKNNPEVIFMARSLNSAMLPQNGNGQGIVDSSLFRSYDANDNRKTVLFRTVSGLVRFYGSYMGGVNFLFSGLATNEVFLIRAECNARMGNVVSAMQDLNTLMIKRWKTGTFIPFSANTSAEALSKILVERRKELCFRSIRWSDLRRLNQESQFQKIITRLISGQTYSLEPNDIKYIYPIPDNEILLSGVQQNKRQ